MHDKCYTISFIEVITHTFGITLYNIDLKGVFTMSEKKKRKYLTVESDAELEAAIKERMEYLQEKRPDVKVTISMALRHAILHTGYKRSKKGCDE